MAKKKKIRESRQLKEFRRRRKIQRQQKIYDKVRKVFTPNRRDRDSFVFVNRRGKRVPPTSKAKGFLFYVTPKGGKTVQKYGPEKELHRVSDFDVSRSGKEKAVKKWERKLNLKPFGRVRPIENPKGVSYRQVGKRITDALDAAFYKGGRRKPQMKVEIAATIGKKTVRTSVIMTSGQVKNFLDGKDKGVADMVWTALSTELAMSNLVTFGSSENIRKRNKRRQKKNWRTKDGEKWGKSGYKQVAITKVEFKFSK